MPPRWIRPACDCKIRKLSQPGSHLTPPASLRSKLYLSIFYKSASSPVHFLSLQKCVHKNGQFQYFFCKKIKIALFGWLIKCTKNICTISLQHALLSADDMWLSWKPCQEQPQFPLSSSQAGGGSLSSQFMLNAFIKKDFQKKCSRDICKRYL